MKEFAEKEISRARRNHTSFSLIMLDIDHFKRFNDIYGHDVGDAALREIADFFRKRCRKSDVICRYGSEEFVILLPDCSLEDAVTIANGLCRGVREQVRILHHNETLSLTVSMGGRLESCPRFKRRQPFDSSRQRPLRVKEWRPR
ncbi:GGDEF domain-containing protein [Dissulfurimicrobium hydrothermale]|uniref:GGDEF domain-containing protein n=1 Tax=Dissulfurimicrobium hydrothermale TaxID=1750598 RepID=UPI001EDAA117|nr:GGDEF domain-containing protein [Dissulfurimicrobium hydrothermale]UKL13344.1 GGDEF domain-containing protein [Dissulfurimicrobium hydrothermale]